MKEAACSCLERMNLIFCEEARAFRSSLISSPGRPKTYSTPSFSRHRTNSSAAFIWYLLGVDVVNGCHHARLIYDLFYRMIESELLILCYIMFCNLKPAAKNSSFVFLFCRQLLQPS